jgi:hypothetical protein
VELSKTEISDNIKYYYIALVKCQDHNLYKLDGEQLSSLIKGSFLKIGYILNKSKQITQIIDSFTYRGIDYSLYKLRQSIK